MEDRTFMIVLAMVLMVGVVSLSINRCREHSKIEEDHKQHDKALKEMKENNQ